MKNYTRTEDFTIEEFNEMFRRMEIFETGLNKGENFTHLCPGRVIASMFFQESSRTSASVKVAMIRLGGGWFGIDGIKGTYLESGEEDLEDTLNGVAPLCDIMAIRHKSLDLTALAEKGFRVPLINAMCGGEEHSLYPLVSIYLMKKHFEDLKGLKIGIYGMSKSSRPMKAAIKVLSKFGVEIYEDPIIPEFKLPEHIRNIIAENGSSYTNDKLKNFIEKIDYLFVIEGLPQSGEDPALVDKFNKGFEPITKGDLAKMKETSLIAVHEPRATTDGRLVALKEIDDDPRLTAKKYVNLLIHANMALITYLLGIKV